VSLAIHFKRSLTDMALATGYHLLGVGVAGFLFVPSARIWGKRHLYILGTVVVIFSCIWGGATGPNYKSFLWARIFQGVGLAPFEALVNASVGDLYHVHERGVRMALSNLALFGGAFLTPVFVGMIADRLGYQWTFYFVAIFAAALLPLVVFCCPETAYRREARFDIDTMGNLIVQSQDSKDVGPTSSTAGSTSPPSLEQGETNGGEKRIQPTTTPVPPSKATFWQSVAPFNGRKTDESYLTLLFRPFPLFLHPGILWACLIQGVMIGFTVLIGVTLAAIFLGPPLWFGELETGYMYTGAFIGAILGFALTGLLSDPSAKIMTKLNAGVYEPEFRMVLVIPQLILGGAGLFGFGWTTKEPKVYGWVWPDFFFALVVMGMVCGAVASALYIVDAHREYCPVSALSLSFSLYRKLKEGIPKLSECFKNTVANSQPGDMSIEGFTCLLVFKNVFSFGLTFKGFDWLVESGDTKHMFVALGSVQVAVCALTIPMCKFFPLHSLRLKGLRLRLLSRKVVEFVCKLTTKRYLRQEKQVLFPPTQRLLQSDRLDRELHNRAVREGQPGFGIICIYALLIIWALDGTL
jgi:MFS family permease